MLISRPSSLFSSFFSVWLFGFLALPASAQCQYEVVSIFGPVCNGNPPLIYALSINERGQVCGYYNVCDIGPPRPFVWTPFPNDPAHGTFVTIPLPPGFGNGQATDINDNGVVVGYGSKTGFATRAFVYKDGHSIELPPVQGPDSAGTSTAAAINNAGVVVGTRSIGSQSSPTLPKTAFLWTEKEGFTDLNPLLIGPNSGAMDIDEDGTVVGWAGNASGSTEQPFKYHDGVVEYLPLPSGAIGATARGIRSGLICGSGGSNSGGHYLNRGLYWVNGTVHDVGTIPPYDSFSALSINAQGQIVGGMYDFDQANSASFLYSNDTLTNLGTLLENPTDYGTSALHINNNGSVSGYGYTFNNGVFEAAAHVIKPLNEPIGDINHDCRVDINDLSQVIVEWGTHNSIADIDANGLVDINDLTIVILNWSVNS